MQRPVKNLLLSVLLILCAPLGFHHAQGERDLEMKSNAEGARSTSAGQVGSVAAQINGGSFVLEDLSLTGTTGSTILKGNLVNRTNHRLDPVTFEVKAYDRAGNPLRGFEEKTIFTARSLDADACAPINSGYGVWLQGIPLNSISRIEIYETSEQTDAALVSQSLDFQR